MEIIRIAKNNRETTINIIWFFLGPYKSQISVIFFLSLLAGTLEAGTVAALYPILNTVFNPGTGDGNLVLALFHTIAGWLPIFDLFISYCAVFIIFTILTFTVKFLGITYRTRFIAHLVREKQDVIYSKIIKADYQLFIDRKQGDLLYITNTAPQQLSNLISSVSELLSQFLLSFSVLVLLYSLSWLGATGILVLSVMYVFVSRYLGKRVSYNAGYEEMEAIQESNVLFNESISGIKQVKVFHIGEIWISRFKKAIDKRWSNNIKRTVWQQILPNILLLVIYLGVAVAILLIKLINSSGYTELVPVFGAFAFAVFRIIPFVNTIGSTIMAIQTSLPDCELMHRILTEQVNRVIDGNRIFSKFSSEISFNNVSFNYKEHSQTIKNLSISFKKGMTTAIVGRSGSGKTTVINLLLRLFDVNDGDIKIDNYDIREYCLDSWLENIGYVSQDTFILNDTVEKNITFGSEEYSTERIIKAAKYADAHLFISEMPEGYDTILGDKGIRLSGGQAQRIAVARAMIREPEILIFDEATNNLDTISELSVQKAIEEISKKHTVIIVAHRLSTIENADKIIVLEKGQVIEQGTHNELLKNKNAYWKLYQRQPKK